MNTIIFGDSIAAGHGSGLKGGWATQLQGISMFLHKELVYNLSIDGETSRDILYRIAEEIVPRSVDEDLRFILAFGTNDASRLNGDERIERLEFLENLRKVISVVRNYAAGKDIYVMEITPVNENKTSPVSWNDRLYYNNENIAIYNQILREVCEQEELQFIQVLNEVWKIDFNDGLHPNQDAHDKIYKAVLKTVYTLE